MNSTDGSTGSAAELQFEFTPEDYLAWLEYNLDCSPYVSKQVHSRRRISWFLASALMGFGGLSLVQEKSYLGATLVIGGMLLALDRVFWFRRRYIKALINKCKREMELTVMPQYFGEKTLTVSDGHLIAASSVGTTYVPLGNINRIDRTETHTFVVLLDGSTYIIPKDGVLPEKYSQFENSLAPNPD